MRPGYGVRFRPGDNPADVAANGVPRLQALGETSRGPAVMHLQASEARQNSSMFPATLSHTHWNWLYRASMRSPA